MRVCVSASIFYISCIFFFNLFNPKSFFPFFLDFSPLAILSLLPKILNSCCMYVNSRIMRVCKRFYLHFVQCDVTHNNNISIDHDDDALLDSKGTFASFTSSSFSSFEVVVRISSRNDQEFKNFTLI